MRFTAAVVPDVLGVKRNSERQPKRYCFREKMVTTNGGRAGKGEEFNHKIALPAERLRPHNWVVGVDIKMLAVWQDNGADDWLQEKIEQTRLQLHDLAASKGLQHPEVIKKSQLLDCLINQYYKMCGR